MALLFTGLNSSSAVAGLADPGKKEAKQTKETTSSASNETKVKQEPKKDSGNQDSGSECNQSVTVFVYL